jgi:hypothetical protein
MASYRTECFPLKESWLRSGISESLHNLRKLPIKLMSVIALERGACPDAERAGLLQRFSHVWAIAPTASISIICGEASPGIEPNVANAYKQKTLSGWFASYETSIWQAHLEASVPVQDYEDILG